MGEFNFPRITCTFWLRNLLVNPYHSNAYLCQYTNTESWLDVVAIRVDIFIYMIRSF